MFRTIHTIKGTCGFLALNRLGMLAHSGESLLSMLRDGVLTLNPTITSALLEMVDRLLVIDNGQLMADGPKAQVVEALQSGRVGRAA